MRTLNIAAVCMGAGLVVLACGQDRSTQLRERRASDAPSSLGHTSQKLRADEQLHTGLDFPVKTLALTFDDGPGPASFTNALSAYLKAQGIQATFFVNGACIDAVPATLTENDSCDTPTPNASAVMAQIIADGHMIGNHTTTHRDLTTIADGERVEELTFTDTKIAPYVTPNRLFFRPPYGDWSEGAAPTAFTTISASPMNKYIGPIYWGAGGGPTNANQAADWECWQVKGFTTKQCGDLYLKEINSTNIAGTGIGQRGIVLMHDAKCAAANCDNLTNTSLTAGVGNSLDMVKYLVPLLKAQGYTFTTIDKAPSVAADLCTKECATCNAATCLTCAAGKFLANNTCTDCTKTCAAGKFQAAACAASADTTCTTCTACAAGTFQASACSPTADAVCTPCAAGTFSTTAAATKCDSCGSCDDNNACTTDACSPQSGCTHTAIAGCTAGASSGTTTSSSGSTSSGNPGDPNDGGTPADTSDDDKGCAVTPSSSTPHPASWLLAMFGLAALTRRRRAADVRSL